MKNIIKNSLVLGVLLLLIIFISRVDTAQAKDGGREDNKDRDESSEIENESEDQNDDSNEDISESDDSGKDGDDDINDDKGGLFKQKNLDRTEERTQKIEEKRKEMENLFKNKIEERVNKFVEQRINVINMRFEKIIARIQTKIDALKTAGKDTTKAEGYLTQTKNIFTQIKSINFTYNPNKTPAQFAEEVKMLQSAMQEIKMNLKNAVFELKGLDDDYAKSKLENNNENEQ